MKPAILKRPFLGILLAIGAMSAQVQAGELKIVFPTPPTTLGTAFYVAKDKGYFKGLEIAEVYINGDTNALRALISGAANVGVIGNGTVFSAIAQGAKLRVIGTLQPVSDLNLVVAKASSDKISDLQGKTFASTGPGNVSYLLGNGVLKKHGVDLSTVRNITITGGSSGSLQAVIAGRADASLVNTITGLRSVKAGDVKILAHAGQELANYGYIFNVVREESLADPEFVKSLQIFTDGIVRAARFVIKNPDESATILHARANNLDRNYLGEVIKQLNESDVWPVNGGISHDSAKASIESYVSGDVIKQVIPVDQVFDFRFVDASIKSFGKSP